MKSTAPQSLCAWLRITRACYVFCVMCWVSHPAFSQTTRALPPTAPPPNTSSVAASPVASPAVSPAVFPAFSQAAPKGESTVPQGAPTTATKVAAPKPVITNSAMDADMFYNLLLAELERVGGQPLNAIRIYTQLAQHLRSEQLFEKTMQLVLELQEWDNAKVWAQEWLKIAPSSTLAYNYLFELHYRQKQYHAAWAALRKFLALQPDNKRAEIIQKLFNYFSAVPDAKQAASDLTALLQPYTQESTAAHAAHAANTGANTGALTNNLPANIGAATRAAARFTIARMQVFAGQPTQAAPYIRDFLAADPKAIEGWLLQATLEIQNKQWEKSEASFKQFLALAKTTDLAPNDEAYTQTYLGLSRIADTLKDYPKARQWLSQIEGAATNPSILYEQAMLFEKEKNLVQMEALLKKVIQLAPDNAAAFNALGYSLADRGERLDEAKTLIEKALQLEPLSPAINDSMGWVLFRLGQLEPALSYLQASYNAMPEAEIAAHLGEVLWQLNRKEEALAIWREAQKKEPQHDVLRSTLQRLGIAL